MFKNSKNGMGLVIGVALAAGLTGSVTAGGIDEPKDVLGPKLSRDWRSDTSIMTLGADGKVIYLYGESQPEVVCAPLRLCEIELQAGELVEDTFVGDNVRWKVDPAVSGSPQGNKIHLVVKPTAPNLATSLVVTTTRRVYHINLKSHPSEYMARVAFIYPEDVQAKFERENDRIEASTIQSSGEPAENLNFQYRIRGFSSWRPQRGLQRWPENLHRISSSCFNR